MARILLVLATVVLLLSMGGGMAFAWWILVPLHWLMARDAGPVETAGWALLAAASVGEVAWMLGYSVVGDGALTALLGTTAFVVTALGFLVVRAQRLPLS